MQPGQLSLTSRVELAISCRELMDKDYLSKSDPMVVLYQMGPSSRNFIEFGRTEMLMNCLNPDFSRHFEMDYRFEESQKLKFEVYDIDSPNARLTEHDFLGSMTCTLGELVSRGVYECKLEGVRTGRIIITASEIAACKETLTLHLAGEKLDKKDFFGKSDPFMEIYRANEPDAGPRTQFTLVHRTEYIKRNLNPTWQPFTIRLSRLCHGDKNRPLRFDCYDYDNDGSHDFIGTFVTTVNELLTFASNPTQNFLLINPRLKAKKRSYKNSGIIHVKRVGIEIENTFIDYISGGTELDFSVAIDFTASNGNPHSHTSLHHIDPSPHPRLNQYETAIVSVGEIVQDYDTDKMFPGFGFGALLPPRGEVSHCFPLTFNPHNPYCSGVSGLMEAYRRALRSLSLYGPTNFENVIRNVMQAAASQQDGTKYFILLIITDGIITDMQRTIRAIIEASRLPMSIIIIGVGMEDFSAMDQLDSDDQLLRQGGMVAERDIVQFVPLRDFVTANDVMAGRAALAQEVLAELPDQLVLWMRRKGIKPLQRPPPTYNPQQMPQGGDAPPPYPGNPGAGQPPGAFASAPPFQ